MIAIQGTIKDLVDQKITVNSVILDQAMLSVLVRCGIGKAVGVGSKPNRGKTPLIYSFESTRDLRFGAN